MSAKEALRDRFSSDPDSFYRVELFGEKGFTRKKCRSCGKFFWSLKADQMNCPNQPCQSYTFLGDPPTSKRLDYIESWKEVEDFFVKNDHESLPRYPVVCRWRPDLFFTVASIIDFQRIESGNIVFELPSNPLIVPQVCLRFNDIQNVGVTGKHFTSFCMLGQTALTSGSTGYWKDRCIDLDYRLLTERFGITPEEISFVEDVWIGYGAFGYSLEYFARGLELGNAVFTAYEGTVNEFREMPEKIIDMGAGLERLSWITQGTATAYDTTFSYVLKRMLQLSGVTYDPEFYLRYARLAGSLNIDETTDLMKAKARIAIDLKVDVKELNQRTEQLEGLYAVADHIRSLVFAIADGALPSNVGGGYNLRILFRRALAFVNRFGWNLRLEDIASWHIDYLRTMYPELEEHRNDIQRIMEVEERRYVTSRERVDKIAASMKGTKVPTTVEELLQLYDSDGITPELLIERGVKVQVPQDFYARVTDLHSAPRHEVVAPRFNLEGLPPTRLLFYEERDLFEFDAKILRIFEDRFMVLDRTGFYARAGGQEHDLGTMSSYKIVSVEKHGNVIVHEIEGNSLKEGDTVHCSIDSNRRSILMRHHTATHIVNGAAQKVLGPWVWQHSAYKDIDMARLDITHHAHLTREELVEIENMANEVVRQNRPVNVQVLPRSEAEQKYGFRLYQGGIAPSKDIRVINIDGFDIEACGGTHVSQTGDIGVIKLLKSERVQDGIERLTFVAGEPAMNLLQHQEDVMLGLSQTLGAQQSRLLESVNNLKSQFDEMKKGQKLFLKKMSPHLIKEATANAIDLGGVKLYSMDEVTLDEELHTTIGEQAIAAEPSLVYFGLFQKDSRVRLVVFVGKAAQSFGLRAGEIAREASSLVGGGGGGDARFGQGGGSSPENIHRAKERVLQMVKAILGTQSSRTPN